MEKLKAKHDHKLTDILKVAIFGLMLILPGLILLPSMLYYGVNEYATAPTEQVEKIEYERVNFNQYILNGNYTNDTGFSLIRNTFDYSVSNNVLTLTRNDNVATDNYSLSQDIYNYAFITGHKFLISLECRAYTSTQNTFYGRIYPAYTEVMSFSLTTNWTKSQNIWTSTFDSENYSNCFVQFLSMSDFAVNDYVQLRNFQIIDLTKMFGSGNEPTIQEFNSYYPDEYYEYAESRYEILEIATGTYETYTDITSQIQYNWNSLWQQPLFSWTNYTILKQGLDNFTYVFGITQTSYINNLITYELIMVAIYIVIDIVLTLFKWLTHLIGEK